MLQYNNDFIDDCEWMAHCSPDGYENKIHFVFRVKRKIFFAQKPAFISSSPEEYLYEENFRTLEEARDFCREISTRLLKEKILRISENGSFETVNRKKEVDFHIFGYRPENKNFTLVEVFKTNAKKEE